MDIHPRGTRVAPAQTGEGPLGAGLLGRPCEPTTESVIAHGLEVVRGHEVRDIRTELPALHVRGAEMEPRPDARLDYLVERLIEAAERTRLWLTGTQERRRARYLVAPSGASPKNIRSTPVCEPSCPRCPDT
jgi:hypothetical protein